MKNLATLLFLIALLLFGLLLLVPVAEAGNCGTVGHAGGYRYPVNYGYRYPVFAAPTYCTPGVSVHVDKYHDVPKIVQPVVIQEQLAPAFVFQVLSAFQQPTVPATAGYPISYQGNGQAQAKSPWPVQAQARTTSVGGASNAALSEEQLDALAERLARKLGGNKPSLSDDPVPRIGGSVTTAAATTQQQDANAGERACIEYMAKACVECHREPQSKGGVVLFNSAGDFAPRRTSGQPLTPAMVYESMASGSMPPRGPKVAQETLAGIIHWKDSR